ncbi:glycosyltransferase [Limnoglobus roseus]|uniref:GT4 family glycosyltransferase n=1 Tax=Limnoglobus roseus TaxID=2598579 RepID=A0A5C1AMZ0_9BACT|nr:glycosyltransferase [Limnoglobus roseus]QEL18278.1 GT4 family glycosyltransferase [Limnoglobus roseus]
MHLVHLTASTLFGGPERQMLGLAEHLPGEYRSSFLTFRENGRCQAFLDEVRQRGFAGEKLRADFPKVRSVLRELTDRLAAMRADVLLTHSYKPNILGRVAARRLGIPVVAVSRGWTWENWKVRQYERLDRLNLRYLDRVVAVSEGQAQKVLAAGVPADRVSVIHNGSRVADFQTPDPGFDTKLHSFFPADTSVSHVVLSAGRLSPEKGFDVLIEAAVHVLRRCPTTGFVHFGEGVERERLEAIIRERGLTGRFVLKGFTTDLDRFLPWSDLVVLPSHTEGLPNVALEASAAGVAVVATAVGGTPEVIADGETGRLVPPGQPEQLADGIAALLADDRTRMAMGRAGRLRMQSRFTFAAQAAAYQKLFASLGSPTVFLQERVTCQQPPSPPSPEDRNAPTRPGRFGSPTSSTT